MSFLVEVAIQLKTGLSFLLGLAGMFTIFRSVLTAAIGMPKASDVGATHGADIQNLRTRIWWVVGVTLVLFVVAVWLYLGPINSIDVAALQAGGTLTRDQKCAILALILIALAILALDITAALWRRTLGEKIAAKKI